MRSSLLRIAPGIVFIVLVLLGIELAVNAGLVRRALLPPPTAIAEVFWDMILSGEIWEPLAETVARLLSGFVIGSFLGVVLGVAMGWWRPVYSLFEPLVECLRPIPKAALVPALILFLGIGEGMKLTSIALAAFFPVLINTIQGVRGTDGVLVDTARTYRMPQVTMLRRVVLPAALPFILAGMRTSLGLGLVLAVLSEMLAGTGGVGFLILDMQRGFRIRQMYAWIGVLALLGVGLNLIFSYAERRLLHWQRTA